MSSGAASACRVVAGNVGANTAAMIAAAAVAAVVSL